MLNVFHCDRLCSQQKKLTNLIISLIKNKQHNFYYVFWWDLYMNRLTMGDDYLLQNQLFLTVVNL